MKSLLCFQWCAGVGFAMNIVSGMCALYYNIIIAWALYYFGHVFTRRLPWTTCDNDWNTDKCYSMDGCRAHWANSSTAVNGDSPQATLNDTL